jgi:hypothetical protein
LSKLLGDSLVVEITPKVVKRYQADRLKEKAGPKTINDEVQLLLRLCGEQGALIPLLPRADGGVAARTYGLMKTGGERSSFGSALAGCDFDRASDLRRQRAIDRRARTQTRHLTTSTKRILLKTRRIHHLIKSDQYSARSAHEQA